MKTAEYDFLLPGRLIADRPLAKRDDSRLLVLHRDGEVEHRRFSDLPDYLRTGDMLLLNKTKVFPSKLEGKKRGGGRIEILLVREISLGLWEILAKGKYSGPLLIAGKAVAEVRDGTTVRFGEPERLGDLLREHGLMPLPPYIRRRPDALDRERYQTVYAESEGSIAAPTAGLHFTRELLHRIGSNSVLVRSVTLHVGTGTFRPVKTEEVDGHLMEREVFEIDPLVISEMREVKARGNRIIAVGTTTTRAVEGYLSGQCEILSANGTIKGTTNIFIREGYGPRGVDSLITNFHLPRSTPLMLTAVFAGRERLLKNYESAISMGYRFFSYGDAMLVL
ncbi:MAG: tRNA preQ1(34) S-adenosylmethionine ribosyltransferase-isomerase QueA [Nitrospiraceae bacterium]|nr:tRNA preQ1(34) S-adenosylmethionine ribosyltransferase-isomerase QueA [Nitrospiraceae bacterium]